MPWNRKRSGWRLAVSRAETRYPRRMRQVERLRANAFRCWFNLMYTHQGWETRRRRKAVRRAGKAEVKAHAIDPWQESTFPGGLRRECEEEIFKWDRMSESPIWKSYLEAQPPWAQWSEGDGWCDCPSEVEELLDEARAEEEVAFRIPAKDEDGVWR